MTSAEPLTDAKRKKLETGWGARVCDCFGMTEVCLLGAEDREHGGFRFFTDFAFPEVLDPESLEPVAEGDVGVLVVTPLFTNTATPFLRWNSGDLVVLREGATGAGPFDAFPLLQHARRTMGFFKIRGVNINHADFEEFMACHAEIHDFRLEACNNGGLDTLRLLVEPAPGSNLDGLPARLAARVASRFEVACEVVPLPAGTLAAQQAHAVKPIRFEDRRETIAASPEPRAAIPPLS
jgi:phenylacetate-CoA ligase